MVTTKHCCYGVCVSDSRYPQPGVWFIGFGKGFPKPTKEREKCVRWVNNCGQRDFTINNVNKDTYICSLHFVGGNGQKELNPDPIKLGMSVTRPKKRRAPVERTRGEGLDKKQKVEPVEPPTEPENIAQILLEFSSPTETSMEMSSAVVTNTLVDKSTQTEDKPICENVSLAIENKLLQNEVENLKFQLDIQSSKVKKSRQSLFHVVNAEKCENVKFNELSVDSMIDDDKKFRFYTGLTYTMFLSLWQFLGSAAYKLRYWNTEVTDPEKTPGKRRVPKRKLSPQNELFLTLMRLRLGLLQTDLA